MEFGPGPGGLGTRVRWQVPTAGRPALKDWGTEGLRAGPTSPGLPAPDRPEGPGTPTGSASRRARQLPSLVAKTAACVRLSKPSLDSMLET